MLHWFTDSWLGWFIHSESHVFSESLVHSFIASLFSSFIDSSVHWFIDSLLCWFIDSLVLSVTCMDSFMSFHRYLSHIFSVVDAPHNFMPSLLLHLKTGYFFPIYIHTGFKFSKLSPRCGLGTTWYNWCLEIPLKLVLDTLRMKSDERVVMKELLRLVVLQIEAQAQLNRFRNSKRTFALRWQNPNTSYQNLLNHFIQALLLLIVFLMFLILRGCHIIGHQRLHIFFATENSFDLRALFIRMRRRFPSWVLR